MNKISTKLEQMNEFLSSQDLVDLGIYKSLDAAYLARVRSDSPEYIKLKHRVLYPKAAVVDFLKSRLQSPDNSIKKNGETNEHE